MEGKEISFHGDFPADWAFARAEWYELLAIQGSLWRAQGKTDLSESLFFRLEKFAESRGELDCFYLLFEIGLTALKRGEHANALKYFQWAGANAVTLPQKLFTETNSLLCLEDLSLPQGEKLKQVIMLDRKVPREQSKWVIGNRETILCYRLRKQYKEGEISAEFSKITSSPKLLESTYFKIWALLLPYHALSMQDSRSAEIHRLLTHLVNGNSFFFLKNFRLRTLTGTAHPEDFLISKPGELAGRIYLWTWNWLLDPSRQSLEQILELLQHLREHSTIRLWPSDDRLRLIACLRWLSLFDRMAYPKTELIVHELQQRPFDFHPLLHFEVQLTEYLLCLAQNKKEQARELLKALRAQPLWRSTGIYFKQIALLTVTGSTPLDSYIRALRDQLQLSHSEDSATHRKTRVFLDQSKLRLAQSAGSAEKTIASRPLCLALYVLRHCPAISFQRLYCEAYECAHFEPDVHRARVFNLVTRLKKLFPAQLSLKTKGDAIYCQGQWRQFRFIELNPREKQLANSNRWRSVLDRNKTPQSFTPRPKLQQLDDLLLREFGSGCRVERKRLETWAGVSKSTSNRLLRRWLKRGLLKRTGRGKNTAYTIQGER